MSLISNHAEKLGPYVRELGPGLKITAIHLYGIEFGAALNGLTVADCKSLLAKAGLKDSLGTELHKGIRLSNFAKRI